MKARLIALLCALALAAGCDDDGASSKKKPQSQQPAAQQPAAQQPQPQPDDGPGGGSIIGRVTQDVVDLDKITRPYRIVTHGTSGDDLVLPLAIFRDVRMDLAKKTAAYNLRLYRAGHDDQAPATADEFVKEILKPASLELPALPQKQAYAYDGKKGRLVVVEFTDG